MSAFRNLFTAGKFHNIWNSTTVGIQHSNNVMCCAIKSIRSVRYIRNNINKKWIENNFSKQDRVKPRLYVVDSGSPPSSGINVMKPVVFTVAFSSASLVTAAIWQYESSRARARRMVRRPFAWFNENAQHSRKNKIVEEISRLWNCLSESEKVFYPICLLNVLVFVAWKIPSLQPTMMLYFTTYPAASKVCWPLVLSTFSHYSFLHLCANMFVLQSFSSAAVRNLGQEQFVGFYLSAGCVSSLASYLYKYMFSITTGSLGASGAIMAVIGYTCTAYPDSQLAIIFLPMIKFEAHNGLKALMAFDLAGLIFNWKFLDHAAHLGGAVSGLFWFHYGHLIWAKRSLVVQPWHNFRSSFDR